MTHLNLFAVDRRPMMLFDGDCSFCRSWVRRWQDATGDRVRYVAYQDASELYSQIPTTQLCQSVHLLEANGRYTRGAEAVFRARAMAEGKGLPLWFYQYMPGFGRITEWGYRKVADHRLAATTITRILWGNQIELPRFSLSNNLFLRALGLIYAIAFISWGSQVLGLVGSQGIWPATIFLGDAHAALGSAAFVKLPTLFWFSSTDWLLYWSTWLGVALGVAVALGFFCGPCLLALWVLYLSHVTIGIEFLSFQWDNLLLEAGFLAVFLGPWRTRLAQSCWQYSPLVVWLGRWLLFRLMFMSGAVKLMSGDVSWRSLSALDYHYFTQPLPTALAWYAHQLPTWFNHSSVVIMFVIELAVPFLIFGPRRLKLGACFAFLIFQALIAATGNYAFFNLLAAALCLLLIDDASWRRWMARIRHRRTEQPTKDFSHSTSQPRSHPFQYIIASILLLITIAQLGSTLRLWREWSPGVATLYEAVAPFRSVNSYGLFAAMTTVRPEIVFEGSDDGIEWREYEFKYKPGEILKRPAYVWPHQPRLDWQMWFAALGNYRESPWVLYFMQALLRGSPPVLDLLGKNPFPEHTPRYLRAELYEYTFTDQSIRARTGAWWTRTPIGQYCPVVSLQP